MESYQSYSNQYYQCKDTKPSYKNLTIFKNREDWCKNFFYNSIVLDIGFRFSTIYLETTADGISLGRRM